MNKLLKIGTVVLSIAVICVASTPVFAIADSTDANTPGSAASTAKYDPTPLTPINESSQSSDTATQKVCVVRRTAAGNIERRVSQRGQARLSVITAVAGKVENYYTTKSLNVSNYEALVSDINTQKDAAQAAVSLVKTDASQVTSVTCGSGEGKAAVGKFKTDLKAEQTALTNYKTAVSNLITVVRAAKTTSGGA